MRNRGAKQQLLLRKGRQTAELEIVKRIVEYSVGLWRTSVRTVWCGGAGPSRMEETRDSLRAGAVGAPTTQGSFAATEQKRRKEQYGYRLLGTNSLKEGAMRHDA
jgi:hypothetical protein